MLINAPGLYEDVSIENYHSSPGISSSGIGLIIPPNCPKMYWNEYLNEDKVRKTSPDFDIGSAVHTLVLEPQKFDKYFCVTPKFDRRTKEGKKGYAEFMALAQGKTMLDEEQFSLVKAMADQINGHKVFQKIYDSSDLMKVEASAAWIDDDSGALLRTRPDFFNESMIMDIKTTRDVRPRSFGKSVGEYGYHRQAAMACDGLSEVTGIQYDTVVLFVVSKEPPHLIKAYMLDSEAIEQGRKQYKLGAKIYKECLDSGIWPGYDEVIDTIGLPSWAFSEDE